MGLEIFTLTTDNVILRGRAGSRRARHLRFSVFLKIIHGHFAMHRIVLICRDEDTVRIAWYRAEGYLGHGLGRALCNMYEMYD
jgi:hypothetical protein